MVRHIVMLNYRDGFSLQENRANALGVKRRLEALRGHVDGILEFTVYIDALPTSDKDLVINSVFESVEALAAYQVHPEHKKAAAFVASVMQGRICIDYHEEPPSLADEQP